MPAAELRATGLFRNAFGEAADGVVRAPGRVNIIGDHTDYNGGFVLPIAIDRDICIAFRARGDDVVRLVSEHGPDASFSLAGDAHADPQWADYVRGIGWALDIGPDSGWDGAVASDVPIGAGLSSSAALEIGAALVFESVRAGHRSREHLALLAQRAENDWVGMECGIMDQLTVATAKPGHALLIDCTSLVTRHVPVPEGFEFVVLDTTTRRALTDSAYGQRRATCEAAAKKLGVTTLRDLSPADLSGIEDEMDELSARRVRHVVTENDRVLAAADAMAAADATVLGRLMTESHASLRTDFEASTAQVDAIVNSALSAPGALGARMTGAGFGGCAVALVEADATTEFAAAVRAGYQAETGLAPEVFPTGAGAAAAIRKGSDGL